MKPDVQNSAENSRKKIPRRRMWRRLREGVLNSWLFCAGLRAAVWIVAHLPLKLARWMGASTGRLFFYLERYRRPLCLENLSTAFPEKSSEEKLAILKGCY